MLDRVAGPAEARAWGQPQYVKGVAGASYSSKSGLTLD